MNTEQLQHEQPTRAEIIEALRVRKREYICSTCGAWIQSRPLKQPDEHKRNCPHYRIEKQLGL